MNETDSQAYLHWKSLEYYGTARLFAERARKLTRLQRALTFTEFAVPFAVGLLIMTFEVTGQQIKPVIYFAGTLLGIQSVLSLWAFVNDWDDSIRKAEQSVVRNLDLQRRWDILAREWPSINRTDLETLERDAVAQDANDYAQHISDKEKRFGLRQVLYEKKLACPVCRNVPTSRKPTKGEDCDACGKYGLF